jgi:hypothetical protein
LGSVTNPGGENEGKMKKVIQNISIKIVNIMQQITIKLSSKKKKKSSKNNNL